MAFLQCLNFVQCCSRTTVALQVLRLYCSALNCSNLYCGALHMAIQLDSVHCSMDTLHMTRHNTTLYGIWPSSRALYRRALKKVVLLQMIRHYTRDHTALHQHLAIQHTSILASSILCSMALLASSAAVSYEPGLTPT